MTRFTGTLTYFIAKQFKRPSKKAFQTKYQCTILNQKNDSQTQSRNTDSGEATVVDISGNIGGVTPGADPHIQHRQANSNNSSSVRF